MLRQGKTARTTARRDNGKPRPAGILVAGLADVRVAFQRLPTEVAGHARNMRDIPPQLEQARHAVVAQVVDVQPQLCWHLFSVDSNRGANLRESAPHCVGCRGKKSMS